MAISLDQNTQQADEVSRAAARQEEEPMPPELARELARLSRGERPLQRFKLSQENVGETLGVFFWVKLTAEMALEMDVFVLDFFEESFLGCHRLSKPPLVSLGGLGVSIAGD